MDSDLGDMIEKFNVRFFLQIAIEIAIEGMKLPNCPCSCVKEQEIGQSCIILNAQPSLVLFFFLIC